MEGQYVLKHHMFIFCVCECRCKETIGKLNSTVYERKNTLMRMWSFLCECRDNHEKNLSTSIPQTIRVRDKKEISSRNTGNFVSDRKCFTSELR